ncbi:hypothetical protein [Marinobacterium sedimentorum]|uniref:hypothetical protein n=1 Tax=Marinobacterium sedimentorum TaxID=2927804 RepID=UPI0020C682C5|nr:hypothetical protein [Marinobacterium sedimentorum]MCP8689800.1 hypothetical protein [Marinobacterium sedimentorum]
MGMKALNLNEHILVIGWDPHLENPLPGEIEFVPVSAYNDPADRQRCCIAYFRDQSLSQLLQHHCPNIECTPSVAVELMLKADGEPEVNPPLEMELHPGALIY